VFLTDTTEEKCVEGYVLSTDRKILRFTFPPFYIQAVAVEW
jgi:hypothetical protein